MRNETRVTEWPGTLSAFPSLNRLNAWPSLFDRLFQENLMRGMSPASNEFSPVTDIEETENHYLFSIDLPGIRPEEIQIDVTGNQLNISGERSIEKKSDEESRRYVERQYGSFCRSYTLPSEVDPNRVEAEYENGVLCVAVPKTEAAKKSKINVKTGKGGLFARLTGKRTHERAA